MNTPQTWSDSPIHDELAAWELLKEARRERDEAREYADRLAEGLPDGMLPKDVEVLREANLGLAINITAVTEQRDDYLTELRIVTERLKGNRHPDDNGIMANGEIDVKEIIEQRDSLIKAIEPLEYWRDISECDCSCPLPQGGCLRCDLNRILKLTNPNSQDQARYY